MLAASLWPMVNLLVESHQLGTAYGLMQSWQNLGLAVIAIAVGAIAEKGWIQIEIFFAACVSCKSKLNSSYREIDHLNILISFKNSR